MRTRCHRRTAIEIFMVNGRRYFVNFPSNQSLEVIKSLPLPEFVQVQREEFIPFFHSLQYAQMWTAGRLSNFQYLIALNLFSGRSFKDPSQYPLLPWTIHNVTGEVLNLLDSETFRDFSLPIGAIGKERVAELLVKQNDLKRFRGVGYL
jgi:hypothetical protein